MGFGELGGNWEARKIWILRGGLKSLHHQLSKWESQMQLVRFLMAGISHHSYCSRQQTVLFGILIVAIYYRLFFDVASLML